MRFKTTKTIITLFAAIWPALLPMSAHALSGGVLGVAPALVSVKVDKGSGHRLVLSVYNDGSSSMTVESVFQDFTLSPAGKVVFLPGKPGKKSWSAASWLKLSKEKFKLEGGEAKDIELFIVPPPDAEVGTHRTLVTFSTISKSVGKRRAQVLVKAGVSAVILVNIAGKTAVKPLIVLNAPRIALGAPSFKVILGNKGNVHYFAEGALKMRRRGGGVLAGFSLKRRPPGAMVLPAGKRIFNIEWNEAPYAGIFVAEAAVRISGGRRMIVRKNFIVIRWELLAAIFLLLVTVALVIYILSKFKLVKRE